MTDKAPDLDVTRELPAYVPGSVRVEQLRHDGIWHVLLPLTNRPAAELFVGLWRRRGWAASRFRIIALDPAGVAHASTAVQDPASPPVPCRRSDAGGVCGESVPDETRAPNAEGSAEA